MTQRHQAQASWSSAPNRPLQVLLHPVPAVAALRQQQSHFLVRHGTNTLLPRFVRVAMLLTDDGCVDYVGWALLAFLTTGILPLIEVKISGPHRAGQYLRRTLSACFLDFDQYRCRVDFRFCLPACGGNVIESRPESINPDCSLQSKRLSRLPVRAALPPIPIMSTETLASCAEDRQTGVAQTSAANKTGLIIGHD
jgi:hypothetical protein